MADGAGLGAYAPGQGTPAQRTWGDKPLWEIDPARFWWTKPGTPGGTVPALPKAPTPTTGMANSYDGEMGGGGGIGSSFQSGGGAPSFNISNQYSIGGGQAPAAAPTPPPAAQTPAAATSSANPNLANQGIAGALQGALQSLQAAVPQQVGSQSAGRQVPTQRQNPALTGLLQVRTY